MSNPSFDPRALGRLSGRAQAANVSDAATRAHDRRETLARFFDAEVARLTDQLATAAAEAAAAGNNSARVNISGIGFNSEHYLTRLRALEAVRDHYQATFGHQGVTAEITTGNFRPSDDSPLEDYATLTVTWPVIPPKSH